MSRVLSSARVSIPASAPSPHRPLLGPGGSGRQGVPEVLRCATLAHGTIGDRKAAYSAASMSHRGSPSAASPLAGPATQAGRCSDGHFLEGSELMGVRRSCCLGGSPGLGRPPRCEIWVPTTLCGDFREMKVVA